MPRQHANASYLPQSKKIGPHVFPHTFELKYVKLLYYHLLILDISNEEADHEVFRAEEFAAPSFINNDCHHIGDEKRANTLAKRSKATDI